MSANTDSLSDDDNIVHSEPEVMCVDDDYSDYDNSDDDDDDDDSSYVNSSSDEDVGKDTEGGGDDDDDDNLKPAAVGSKTKTTKMARTTVAKKASCRPPKQTYDDKDYDESSVDSYDENHTGAFLRPGDVIR